MLARAKILVCTDFSEASDTALRTAGKIGAKAGGEIHLIHAAEIGFYLEHGAYGIMPQSVHESFMLQVQKDLRSRMQEQMQRCGVKCETHIKVGHSASELILAATRDYQINLIVMGDIGASQGHLFQVGSLTKKLAASAPVPLLVAKDVLAMDRVAGLVDVSETTKGVIQAAQDFAQLLDSKLFVISLCQDFPGLYSSHHPEVVGPLVSGTKAESERCCQNTREKIKDFLGPDLAAEIKVEVTRERSIAVHLVEMLHEEGIELAVMKRHQKNAMERFFLGSETSRVLELYRGNLLICPPNQGQSDEV
jgi:nucleotide-binding universal stress UspA family protein